MSKIERIRPGSKAIIYQDGKVLVIRERVRRDGIEKIIHDFPGGGIELGETIQQALHREVFEEIGLKVEIVRPVGCWDFVNKNPEGDVHIVCVGYQCKLIGDEKIDTSKNPASEDIFEAVWLTKEEILSSNEIFDIEDMKKSLENVK